MPTLIGKTASLTYIYNVATMSWGVWDGSLSVGSVVIGSVLVSRFPAPATAACSNVTAANSSSTTILASNALRQGGSFFNDANAACDLKYGTTASTSSFTVKVQPMTLYELPLPVYTGRIDGIWESTVTGSLRVTEVSA